MSAATSTAGGADAAAGSDPASSRRTPIPLYQLQGFLAWRHDLVSVANNPTTEGPLWNAGTWAFANR